MSFPEDIRIFNSPADLAVKFASDMAEMIFASGPGIQFTIALAGGSTPELLYSELGEHYKATINWSHVSLFWGDERCVPPESPESNFGMVRRTLLSRVTIPVKNIHRIAGENDPQRESESYADEIIKNSASRNGLPHFDLVILGLGEDGHTASIFPGQLGLLHSSSICEVAIHPQSGQKRISLTGPVLNNASMLVFLVTGEKKAMMVRSILRKEPGAEKYPASGIVPSSGKLVWLLDKKAASELQ